MSALVELLLPLGAAQVGLQAGGDHAAGDVRDDAGEQIADRALQRPAGELGGRLDLQDRCAGRRRWPRPAAANWRRPARSRKSATRACCIACSSPFTSTFCHSQLRPPGWRGVEAARSTTRLTSASSAALKQVAAAARLRSGPLDGCTYSSRPSTRPVMQHGLAAHRSQRGGQARRVDHVDQGTLGGRIDAGRGGEARRTARLQRQHAHVGFVERACQLPHRLVEQPCGSASSTTRLGAHLREQPLGRAVAAPQDAIALVAERRRKARCPSGRSLSAARCWKTVSSVT